MGLAARVGVDIAPGKEKKQGGAAATQRRPANCADHRSRMQSDWIDAPYGDVFQWLWN